MSVQIAGLSDVIAALGQLPDKLEKRVIRKGLRDGAKVVLNSAREEAPAVTGQLRRNIKIRGGGRAGPGVVALSIGVGSKDFSGRAFYGSFVLFGHFTRPKLKGRFSSKSAYAAASVASGRRFVPANNFLERAYEKTAEKAVNVATESWAGQISELSK